MAIQACAGCAWARHICRVQLGGVVPPGLLHSSFPLFHWQRFPSCAGQAWWRGFCMKQTSTLEAEWLCACSCLPPRCAPSAVPRPLELGSSHGALFIGAAETWHCARWGGLTPGTGLQSLLVTDCGAVALFQVATLSQPATAI